jgi:3-isopropylmalate/(R)-2-methylmalate dehydratase small subunit
MMAPFTTLTSRVIPMPINNVDTDQIIPARFLKVTDKNGLGQVLFCDWRYENSVVTVESALDATPRPDFVLNQPQMAGAQILLAGDNFGCGSSREHAPWALTGWGIRAVISTSFADIFRNNAFKNGLLTVDVDADTHKKLLDLVAQSADAQLAIDLEAQTLTLPDGNLLTFSIDPFAKTCLIKDVDQMGYLIGFEPQILAYEEARYA